MNKLMALARNCATRVATSLTALAVTGAAFAGGGPDYSVITDAIDFADISPLVLGAAGALITLYVLIKGVRIVMGFVKGG